MFFAQTKMSVPPVLFAYIIDFIKYIVPLVEQAFLPVHHLLLSITMLSVKVYVLAAGSF